MSAVKPIGTVRRNLMERPGYTPYCGSVGRCGLGMPRTHFDGSQFACGCGWRSNFEAEFIEQYKQQRRRVEQPIEGGNA